MSRFGGSPMAFAPRTVSNGGEMGRGFVNAVKRPRRGKEKDAILASGAGS